MITVYLNYKVFEKCESFFDFFWKVLSHFWYDWMSDMLEFQNISNISRSTNMPLKVDQKAWYDISWKNIYEKRR